MNNLLYSPQTASSPVPSGEEGLAGSESGLAEAVGLLPVRA
jgi:hypothetical protein